MFKESKRTLTFIMLFLALLLSLLINWQQPMSQLHDFRQSQTALTSYWMARDEIDLLEPPLPLFGPDHKALPMEFPLYQAVVASIAKISGHFTPKDIMIISRMVSFLGLVFSAYAFFRVVRLLWDEKTAYICSILFIATPYSLFWGVSIMIEFWALGFLLFYIESLLLISLKNQANSKVIFFSFISGSLAILIKITTVLVYGPACFLLWIYWIKKYKPSFYKISTVSLAVAILPIFLGISWVLWSDHVKESYPLTENLTSSALHKWNYGTLHQRLSFSTWVKIFGYWILQILTITGVPFLLFGVFRIFKTHKIFLLVSLLTVPLTATLVFTNLYWHHDYYSITLVPIFFILVGVGISEASKKIESVKNNNSGLNYIWLTFFVIITMWLCFVFYKTFLPFDFSNQILSVVHPFKEKTHGDRERDSIIVREIKMNSKKDQSIFVANGSWSSYIAFYSERNTLMSTACGKNLALAKLIPKDFGLIVIDRLRAACPSIKIPDQCLVYSKNNIQVGHCFTVGSE